MRLKLLILWLLVCPSCPQKELVEPVTIAEPVITTIIEHTIDTITAPPPPVSIFKYDINTGSTTPAELLAYANTLIGVPYKYASTNPAVGFDCSGFITYVFNHFYLKVPRSSVDFTNVGQEINLMNAKEGDLVLFTGTNDSIKIVGHMGIVTENVDTLRFIHSTSGRANGVTISNLGDYYKKRFVKVIRIFPD